MRNSSPATGGLLVAIGPPHSAQGATIRPAAVRLVPVDDNSSALVTALMLSANDASPLGLLAVPSHTEMLDAAVATVVTADLAAALTVGIASSTGTVALSAMSTALRSARKAGATTIAMFLLPPFFDARSVVAEISSAALMTRHVSDAHPLWTFIQCNGPASLDAGPAAALRLDGADGPARTGPEFDALVADVTCTKGDLPHALPFGASSGDMLLAAKKSSTQKVALLHAPTALVQLPRTNGALWRLIGQQTPHALRLTQAGLPALKQLFQQFAQLSPSQAQHIDGITGLKHRSVMTLMARKPQPAMVRGIEVTLEIDEQRFVAHSVAVFARVMERFFAPYAPSNSFVQLIIGSSSGSSRHGGTVLWRGEPVMGGTGLL